MAAVVPKLTPTPVFKAPVVPFHKREQVKVRSLGLVAKMIGATVGVEIVFDPKITTAATDCRTKIFLPVLTDTGTEEDAELLKGLVLHEAAHCAETDPEISQTCRKESGPLGNALRNMYEDGRIEKAQALVYPGIPPMIDKALQVLVKRGVYEKPKAEEEPLSAVTGLLISGLRTKYLDQSGLAAIRRQLEFGRDHGQRAHGPPFPRRIVLMRFEFAQDVAAAVGDHVATNLVATLAADHARAVLVRQRIGNGTGKGRFLGNENAHRGASGSSPCCAAGCTRWRVGTRRCRC